MSFVHKFRRHASEAILSYHYNMIKSIQKFLTDRFTVCFVHFATLNSLQATVTTIPATGLNVIFVIAASVPFITRELARGRRFGARSVDAFALEVISSE